MPMFSGMDWVYLRRWYSVFTLHECSVINNVFLVINFFNEKETDLEPPQTMIPFKRKAISELSRSFTLHALLVSQVICLYSCVIFRHRRMSDINTRTLPLWGSWRTLWCKLFQHHSWLPVHLRTRISAPRWWNHLRW